MIVFQLPLNIFRPDYVGLNRDIFLDKLMGIYICALYYIGSCMHSISYFYILTLFLYYIWIGFFLIN